MASQSAGNAANGRERHCALALRLVPATDARRFDSTGRFITCNAKPQPRRAQPPQCVQHAAPAAGSKARAAGLTAKGAMQRARTEARWARRAPAKAPARCEPLAEGIRARMSVVLG